MANMNGLRTSESKEGYMIKEGGNRRSWKKRYFILKENKIEYFKSEGGKSCGTIDLTEGKGVRERNHCKCNWPSAAKMGSSFGLAIKSRTYYFYMTSDQGDIGDWKRIIQDIIEKVGVPNSDWQADHEGKPEESKSFIARKVVSIGSKVTKQAIKYAPVDDRVKKGVGAGADLVKDQAEADPHAGIGQRVAMGVGGTANVVGATGVGGQVGKDTTKVVSGVAGDVAKICKKKDI